MIKRFFATVAFLVAVSLAFCSCCCTLPFSSSPDYSLDNYPTQGNGSTPLFYKATDQDGDVVWLFGSIHVGSEDMYPLPAYVTDAFSAAEGLAVECDIVAAEADTTGLTSTLYSMMYTDGSTIDEHIDAQLYEEAKDILEDNGLPASFMNSFTPSFWSMMIDSYAMLQYELDADLGIDAYLIKRAKSENIPLYEIESVEEQYTMFGSFSEELQIMLLESSVQSYGDPESEELLNELAHAWTEGDEQELLAILTDDTTGMTAEELRLYNEYNYAMMTARNKLMSDFAENALIDGNELFICVGTAHIIGDDGIVQQLRDRGYTVEIVS